MKRVIVACLVALLSGCAGMGSIVEPLHDTPAIEAESPQAKALRLAHAAVNEADAALFALDKVIGANAEAGIWTKAQAQGYLDQSKEYGARVDKARDALRIGNL